MDHCVPRRFGTGLDCFGLKPDSTIYDTPLPSWHGFTVDADLGLPSRSSFTGTIHDGRQVLDKLIPVIFNIRSSELTAER